MTELLNQTLAEIVTANHRAASVFEKYHLDFCCKGKRSLTKACEEKSLPVAPILADLDTIFAERKNEGTLFNYITLSQLCDYIVATHHAYVKQSAPQITAYLEKVANKHGDRHPYIIDVLRLFTELKNELAEHMHKEEQILFPRIKELENGAGTTTGSVHAPGYIEAPVAVMEHQHDGAGRLLEQIREKTNNYTAPEDACTTHRVTIASLQAFEADLHRHVHLENNILFPRATELVRKLSAVSG
jgi:regulator of cell morphogenesis and NO signaling